MKFWVILTLFLVLSVECIKGNTCGQKPKKCSKLKGDCQVKGDDCDGTIYKGKKYCKDKKTCQCCVKKENIDCGQKGKCSQVKGSCQLKEKSCGGLAFTGSKYCKSKTCQCCIHDVEKVCGQHSKCTTEGGVCQIKGDQCDGKKVSGKKMCASKSCQCCIEEKPTTPEPTTPKPTTPKPTTPKPTTPKPTTSEPTTTVSATIYIVDGTNGNDSNSGLTADDAFKSIDHCVGKMKQNPNGTECHVREGRYHEVVNINGLRGSTENHYVIRGYKNEQPIWDGTVPIQPLSWSYDDSTGICSAPVEDQIFALLLDDELLTAARWPNALWSDKTVFENKYWGKFSDDSEYNPDTKYGLVVDDGSLGLAESGINATGSMAVLNIGSWMTYVSPVLHHEPSTNQFTYHHDFGKVKWKLNQYYLEASLELLDAPGEWFFDKDSNQLYFIPPNGACPDTSSTSLRGRTIDYGLIITNTTGLTVKNFKFIAANVAAYSADKNQLADLITLDSIYFKYPSSSHRMLKNNEVPKETTFYLKTRATKVIGKFSVINCVFEGAEGKALYYYGNNAYIHNNLFLYNDWAGQETGGGGTVHGFGTKNEFSRNTLYYNGQSAGLRPGMNCTIKYNYIIGQCHGEIQSDGAGIHIQIPQQNGVNISHNWAMDSPKYGIRFDTPSTVGSTMGHDGYIGYNVVWNTNGIMVKGEKHFIENNMALEKDGSDRKKCTLCVIYKLRKDPVIMNNGTTAINNGGYQVDGGVNVWDGGNYPIAGEVVDNNYSGKDVNEYMVDPDNYDFRPISNGPLIPTGKPTIGPYEPDSNTYWIPGHKSKKASVPIPKNGATVSNTRDVVIFLEGYEADSHNFYFGSDETLVKNAVVGDAEYKSSQTVSEGNMFVLPSLTAGNTYYWRVDAVTDDVIEVGDVWSFNVE